MAVYRSWRLLIVMMILLLGCSKDSDKGPYFDTAVWSLGSNVNGILGDGTENNSEFSIQLQSITNPVRLEASALNSMALTSDGKLFVWGDNSFGQLGVNNQANSLAPIQVLSNHFVRAMTTGGNISAVVTLDGKLWMWGTVINESNGDVFTEKFPFAINGLPRMTDVSCGGKHCLVLSENGEVWSWGNNLSGQLGDGTQLGSLNFRKVMNLPAITHVTVGLDHSLALSSGGEVYVWGSNEFGQLGISIFQAFYPEGGYGNPVKKIALEPEKVPKLENVVNIKAGSYHSLGLRSDGEIMAWGRGRFGQLGSSSHDNLWKPRKVSGISNVTMIYASAEGSCAMTNYGEFYSWGIYKPQSHNSVEIERASPTRIPCFKGAIGIARSNNHYLVAKRKDVVEGDCFIY